VSKSEKLVAYIQESTSTLGELKSMNESLDTRVKNLTSELEKTSRRANEMVVEKETLEI